MDKNFAEKIKLRIALLEEFKPETAVLPAIELMEKAIEDGKKIIVFGNGGSATQASHFCAELVNRFYLDRPALPAIALTTDIANLTAISNDSDFRYVFSRQVEAIGREGDVAMGISTSGTSANVLEALKTATACKMRTIALCGQNIEAFEGLEVDSIIPVSCNDTPAIQEMHLFILHTIAEAIEKNSIKAGK